MCFTGFGNRDFAQKVNPAWVILQHNVKYKYIIYSDWYKNGDTHRKAHITLRILSELEKIYIPLHSAVYGNINEGRNINEDFIKSQIPVSWPKCLLKSRKERKN